VLDIKSQAKRQWKFTSSTLQKQIINKYKDHLQPLCALDELCVPAFVGPDEMGDGVDDIDTMFD